MRRFFVALAILIAPPAFAPPAAAEATEVDLALVLAVDISFSVDVGEQDVQRRGYAAAFRDLRVIRAITGGLNGRIAVAYFEWAGPRLHMLVAPWTLIDGPAAAEAFAARLEAEPVHRGGRTSISAALTDAASLFDAAPWPTYRRVIDVSGDGPNNFGDPVREARDAVLARGITINGLPLVQPAEAEGFDIVGYYEDCVIGGPGAFLLPVEGWAAFDETLIRKLALEIAGVRPPARARIRLASSADCFAGERSERKRYLDLLDGLTGGKPERWTPPEEVWPSPPPRPPAE